MCFKFFAWKLAQFAGDAQQPGQARIGAQQLKVAPLKHGLYRLIELFRQKARRHWYPPFANSVFQVSEIEAASPHPQCVPVDRRSHEYSFATQTLKRLHGAASRSAA